MRKKHRARTRHLIILAVVVLLSTIAPTLHAGGRKEDRLSKADQFIADRRYTDAILALTAFIKESPERFDEAQRRLQRIVRLRDEYNATASELLDVLVNDPTNDERKLEMIRRLEALETAPNRAAREFISRTKETALFTFNKARFEAIMLAGRTLIDNKDYPGAVRKYAEGFALYKEEFDTAGYGQLVVSRVNEGLKTVGEGNTRFINLTEKLISGITALETTFAKAEGPESVELTVASYEAFESLLLEFASLRNASASAGRSFENQFLLLQGADKKLTESSFLPFAFRFVLGRKTEIRPEGILGAMDTLWMELANRVQTAAVATADRSYLASLAVRESGNHVRAGNAFLATSTYAELAMRGIALWSAVAGSESIPALTSYGRSILTGKPPSALRYRTLSRVSRFANVAEKYIVEHTSLVDNARLGPTQYDKGSLAASQAIDVVRTDRNAFRNLAQRIESDRNAFSSYAELVRSYRETSFVGPETTAYVEDVSLLLKEIEADVIASGIDSAAAQYAIAEKELARILSLRNADLGNARLLLDGTPNPDLTPGPKYPAESIPAFKSTETAASVDAANANLLLGSLRVEDPNVLTDARIIALIGAVRDSAGKLQALQVAARTASQDAAERVRQAESARLEAERRYEEARSALSRLNFDLARERLQRSGERFDASLAIQEAPALRTDRDRRLLALSSEITKTENEVVVRDVRRLINEARQAYFAGTFDRAEESLVQAQSRWKTTNVEDEPEVVYWLTLVRGALSIKTGRTIPVTAPLFAEMGQLLSFARRYYEEGRQLLAARRKTEALARFEDAKKKIQEVKIVFPINQEAGLLELRIDQVIDPEAFNAVFRRRLAEAQAKMKDRPQEGYSELQDLYEINPRYAGLKAIIEKAEIDLGLRLPPPDRAALTRSIDLTSTARRIVDANLRGQFPVALEQLNEALRLNPNNDQAVSLKDRIQTDVGGQAAVVLSNVAEKEYQRAVQELQKGNTIAALAIVEQLLRDPGNRNSPRIIELQRRIQSRL